MAIPGFLASRLSGVIAGGIALALFVALIWVTADSLGKNGTISALRGQVTTLTRERDEARSDLQQCRANTATLEAGIARQNAALAAARAEGQARLTELSRAAEQARRDARSAQDRARAIMERPGTGNHCADADALILEAVR